MEINRDNEMINKYLDKVNMLINNGNNLPDNILKELIDIKNKLEDDNISIDNRKLFCVLIDDIFYRIKILNEGNDNKIRR